MAVAMTDTVLNYSGAMYQNSDNSTRLLDAIYSRGRAFGDGIVSRGVRKVNSIEFATSSNFSIGAGEQPSISESASLTAPDGTPFTRDQVKNCIQIFQRTVGVSYLKQSANGTMAGLNIAGQRNNVPNELDFQIASTMTKTKKDLNYTIINGTYQEGSNNTTAWKSKGLISALTATASNYTSIDNKFLQAGIVEAMKKGFQFVDGAMELWVNPEQLDEIAAAFNTQNSFVQPSSRTEAGAPIVTVFTHFGKLMIDYDPTIPKDNMLLLNIGDIAVAELDVPNKGCWFYEEIAKKGAGTEGQFYGQAGLDFGAVQSHILFTKSE